MRRSRPPYQTARERVAARRSALGLPPPSRQPRGCLPLLLVALLIAVVSLVALTITTWARRTLATIEQVDPRRPEVQPQLPPARLPASLREPFNVLLIGVDSRANADEGVRADTLILVHVHPEDNWAGMLSIPRDSVVDIPGLGQRKINAAYAYGYNNAAELYGPDTTPEAAGAALAADTVAGFLKLSVDYTAQVDFRGFEEIVNTLGGITVDVERPILDPAYPTEDFGYERIYIPAGLQVMDGATALRYARSRHSSNDFDRATRQQRVLRAMLSELRARDLRSQAAILPELVNSLKSRVSTTLPISDLQTLAGLAAFAQGLDLDRVLTLSINPKDVRVLAEDGSDIYWDAQDIAAQVELLLAGPLATTTPARIQVMNGTEVYGLAGRLSRRLIAQGFEVNDPADAPGGVIEQTRLIDYTGHPETLQRLAETLGLRSNQIYSTPPDDAPLPPVQTDIVLVIGTDFPELRP